MKKSLIFILCLVFCFAFCGCEKESIEDKNNEATAVLTSVLNEERDFIVYNPYIYTTYEANLEKFRYPTDNSVHEIISPEYYMFVDFDTDGIDELLILDGDITFFLFLDYDGDEVYGHVHKNLSIKDIRTDGSFKRISYYAGYETISNILFDKETSVIIDKTYKDDKSGIYKLDGEDASKEDVEKYFEDWDANTTVVTWEKIDE